jgi:hypothetical protein
MPQVMRHHYFIIFDGFFRLVLIEINEASQKIAEQVGKSLSKKLPNFALSEKPVASIINLFRP